MRSTIEIAVPVIALSTFACFVQAQATWISHPSSRNRWQCCLVEDFLPPRGSLGFSIQDEQSSAQRGLTGLPRFAYDLCLCLGAFTRGGSWWLRCTQPATHPAPTPEQRPLSGLLWASVVYPDALFSSPYHFNCDVAYEPLTTHQQLESWTIEMKATISSCSLAYEHSRCMNIDHEGSIIRKGTKDDKRYTHHFW